MKLLKLLICSLLFCGSAFATTQKLTIESKSSPNEWDSTGSGNKVAMLNDATDGNKIKSLTVSDTDRYVITNMASLDTTILNAVDSVKIFWKMRGASGTGTSTGRVGLGIGTDYSEGATRTFAVLAEGAWSSFEEKFATPPGSRGDWDTDEVDSAVLQIRMVAFTASEVPEITSCSVLVYYAENTPKAFFFTNYNGCETGSNFGKSMVRPDAYPNNIDTIKVVVPANTSDTDYFATIVSVNERTPNSQEWETGPSSIYLNLIKQVNPDSLRVRLLKVDSLCGTIHDSTLWTPKQSISIPRTTQVIDPDAKGADNTWDSTGSGNKVAMLTDGVDGNYIYTADIAINTNDEYTFQDFNYTNYQFGDRIDSIKLFTTAQDNGTGNNKYQPTITLGADVTAGTERAPTTSWVQYTDLFTTPPGSRGTWDPWEIDSLGIRYTGTALGASRQLRVSSCSTVVYITRCCVKVNIDNKNWATGLCNNRLQVQFEWSNPAAASEDTIWFRVGSEAQSRLEHCISTDVSPCQVVSQAGCATQDSILADGEVAAFNQWTNVGGASKTASISDATEGNYIFESTIGEVQRFTFANQGIPSNAIIDSIKVESRVQNGGSGSSPRIQHRLMKDGVTTAFCDAAQSAQIGTSWVSYSSGFVGFPSSPNFCQNIFTRARLDSLNVQFIKTAGGRDIRATRTVVYICYRVPPACEFTLNAANSTIEDALLLKSDPTVNYGSGNDLSITDDNTTLGDRQSVVKFDALKDSMFNRTVASATLYLRAAPGGTGTTLMTYVRGLRKGWTESQVTWNSCSTGVAWTTAGAGSTTNDRYTDIIDSFIRTDTNSAGFYDINVTPYLQLCDGTDTANYKGFIFTAKQNSGTSQVTVMRDSESSGEINAPRITVNYCTAGGVPQLMNIQIGQKRTRKIIMEPSNVLNASGAEEFASVAGFEAEPVIGFSDDTWLWGESREWQIKPNVRVQVIDEPDGGKE